MSGGKNNNKSIWQKYRLIIHFYFVGSSSRAPGGAARPLVHDWSLHLPEREPGSPQEWGTATLKPQEGWLFAGMMSTVDEGAGEEEIAREPLYYTILLQDILCVIFIYTLSAQLNAHLMFFFFRKIWIEELHSTRSRRIFWGSLDNQYALQGKLHQLLGVDAYRRLQPLYGIKVCMDRPKTRSNQTSPKPKSVLSGLGVFGPRVRWSDLSWNRYFNFG